MPESSNTTVLVVTQIVTLLTLIVGMLFQAYRESRNHRWDDEARARLSTKIGEAHVEHMAAIADNTKKTEVAIDAADKAYQEANHVNLKLEHIGLNQIKIDEAAVAESIKIGVRDELTRLRSELLAAARTQTEKP